MASIKMEQTIAGCMDGIHAKKYVAGVTYQINDIEINQKLANIFVNCGAAKVVRERAIEPSETAIVSPSETKKNLSVSEAKKKALNEVSEKVEPVEPVKQVEPAKPVESVEDKKEDDTEPEQKIMRVFELAKKNKVENKVILEIAKKLNIDIKVPMAGLTKAEIEQIEEKLK